MQRIKGSQHGRVGAMVGNALVGAAVVLMGRPLPLPLPLPLLILIMRLFLLLLLTKISLSDELPLPLPFPLLCAVFDVIIRFRVFLLLPITLLS